MRYSNCKGYKLLALLVICLLQACEQKPTSGDLVHLNGYWEIEEVAFPNGGSKSYELNTTIDFIEFKNEKGFRKKVQPKLDGTYKVSDDAEPFTIFEKEGVFIIRYANELSEWEEQIKQISTNNFSVVNAEGIIYRYKRYQPIDLAND